MLQWVRSQAAKGATVVGVCDGVWVLGHAGLLTGRRAVGHWFSFDDLQSRFGQTAWLKDTRYVADGKVITTTGVTASMPVSLALVEAIGGPARAAEVAACMGVKDWSPRHRSASFHLRAGHAWTASVNWLSFRSHEDIGIPVAEGVDEVSLALAADAYSRSCRSSAFSVAASSAPIRTRHGLVILPDKVAGQGRPRSGPSHWTCVKPLPTPWMRP